MRDTNLVNALREHAEWARANEWETPITLGDDLAEAADRIEAQEKEIDALRNELCAQDLITMEGLRKLNTLIWKYTTVHDGGADHEAD